MKTIIDTRIKDEPDGELRRNVMNARCAQERENGRRQGFDEGFELGVQNGYNRAIEDVYKLLGDFIKGNRT